MKNPLLKVLFSAVCLFPFSPVHAQYPYVTGNALQLFQVGAPGENKIHSPRRTPPQNVNLPEVYFDEDLKDAARLGFHPNDNTATVFLSFQDVQKYIESTGHTVRFIQV